ncbi:MAG: hypothetical protein IKO10_02675 [Lachnospiraceae bacterium]|nr:hypothetical protein [Lachnospiraceae bacterium]
MKVLILNGPMGIGKTTVGTCIADKHPGTAFIDGDWCMDLHPFVGTKETKEMAIDNILHMIGNYSKCSACHMVVLAWLMDEDWVCEKLSTEIRNMGLEAKQVTIVCEEKQLKEQWAADRNCPWRTDEWLAVALRSLEHFSKSDDCIKTDGLTIDEVAEAVYDMCQVSNGDGSCGSK